MACLSPIWTTKTETAKRVQSRIAFVLDYATASKHRTGDNPARWRGHLDKLLPKPSKVAKVVNHPALPYRELGAFMKLLRGESGVAAKALEFIILTAARTGEAINAQWQEIDLEAKVWTLPANRMKASREHRVPLSTPALTLLQELKALAAPDASHVFAGTKAGKPLSNMACLSLLQRVGRHDITTHGFRSTFRDWAAEQTNYPRDVTRGQERLYR